MTQQPDSAHKDNKFVESPRKQLRQGLLQWRRNLIPSEKHHLDAQIAQQLLSWLSQRTASSIAWYWPIQAEPDLLNLAHTMHHSGWQISLPRVIAKATPLTFQMWRPDDELDRDEYGIPVPKTTAPELIPAYCLVPCVGFNDAGFRLGYGGGFYDRTLEKFPAMCTIGIAYQGSLIEFDPAAHDQALDLIVTEQGVHRPHPPSSPVAR